MAGKPRYFRGHVLGLQDLLAINFPCLTIIVWHAECAQGYFSATGTISADPGGCKPCFGTPNNNARATACGKQIL